MAAKTNRQRICPGCGSSDILLIGYGLPDNAAFAAEERGEIYLGGCVILSHNPTHHCRDCGRNFSFRKRKKLAPVKSLAELRRLAEMNPAYASIAIEAACNLGMGSSTLEKAMFWLKWLAVRTGRVRVLDEVNLILEGKRKAVKR